MLEKEEEEHQKTRRQELDNGVHPSRTMSPGPARSMGRPSFIKWYEKEEVKSTFTKGALYLQYGKWLKNGELCCKN